MTKRYEYVSMALLVVLVVACLWLAVLRLLNPDMTDLRFFLTYWYLELSLVGIALGMLWCADKQKQGERKRAKEWEESRWKRWGRD